MEDKKLEHKQVNIHNILIKIKTKVKYGRQSSD